MKTFEARFQINICKVYLKKQFITILHIKAARNQKLPINFRFLSKHSICQQRNQRKLSFQEIFDFHCFCVNKSKCRPSLKFLRTVITIEDGMAVSVYIYLVCLVKHQSWQPGHSIFQLLSVNTNLLEQCHIITKF